MGRQRLKAHSMQNTQTYEKANASGLPCASDDEADTGRGEGRRRLDEHRGDAGVHSGQLRSEQPVRERAHAQEAHADECRDERVQTTSRPRQSILLLDLRA